MGANGVTADGTVSADSGLARLVDELTARLRAGGAVDPEAVAAEFPEYAEQLRRLLPAMALLADVSRSAGQSPEGIGAPPAGHDDDSVSGTLGDYRLIREVGRGGMGVVYDAKQISLNRRVALKVLPLAATMDPRQFQRFRHEAQAAAMLHHAHIVPVYGVGCERSVHFYAMQLIDGRSLAAVIDEQRGDANPPRSESTAAFRPPPGGAAESPGEASEPRGCNTTAPVAALSTQPNRRRPRRTSRRPRRPVARGRPGLRLLRPPGRCRCWGATWWWRCRRTRCSSWTSTPSTSASYTSGCWAA
jgi:serine/threonine-protein kinase